MMIRDKYLVNTIKTQGGEKTTSGEKTDYF